MAAPAKLMNLSALLAKLESTYGTAVAVTATTDGHLLALSDRYPALLSMEYAYDGELGPSPGNLGMLKRVAAIGRTVSGQIPMRAKGNGSTATTAAYAATILPNIHTFLRLSGFESTLGTGAYTYTLTPDGTTYGSATMEYYKRGEKWSARGVIGSPAFTIDGVGVPLWTFDLRGIIDTAIADSAMVAPTYPNLTVLEPVASGLTLALGSFTAAVVRSASFNLNRSIETARIDLNATDAHLGFVPNGYSPEFRVTVEATSLVYPTAAGGFDPYKQRLNAEELALSLTVGSAVNNRWKLIMPQAQLIDFTLGNDGPVATTELVFRPYHSTPVIQTDALRVVFD